MLLQNHTVLITGVGSGLGLGVAKYCKAQGAAVIVTDIAADKLAHIAADFDEQDLLLACDVTKISDLEQCKQRIIEKYGRLDAVIGAQGVFDGNRPILSMDAPDLDQLFHKLLNTSNIKTQIYV